MQKKSSYKNHQTVPRPRKGGILLVDKPSGWTSHDVVQFVRGFGIKKVGHCGTLDPRATGLLVLVLGDATKMAHHFSSQDKIYEGDMLLGIETDTQDADGKIIQENDWRSVTREMVLDTCKKFLGDQTQIPPMVSAKKYRGKPLYKLARQGIVVERKPVDIRIDTFDICSIDLPIVSFSLQCSKGTYVRTLCVDIGKILGCGAHLKTLRRMKSGSLNVTEAVSLPQLKKWDQEAVWENCLPLEKIHSYI